MNGLNLSDKQFDELLKRVDKSHTAPSEGTIKMISVLEKKIDSIEKKLNELPTKECMELSNRKLLEEIVGIMEKKNKEIEEKYTKELEDKANKWVEKLIVWIGGVAGLSVIGLIIWALTESIKRFQ